jgi:hypothetical protein
MQSLLSVSPSLSYLLAIGQLGGDPMPSWRVEIIRGRRSEHLGTVEAPGQREAYRLAIEKFDNGSPSYWHS